MQTATTGTTREDPTGGTQPVPHRQPETTQIQNPLPGTEAPQIHTKETDGNDHIARWVRDHHQHAHCQPHDNRKRGRIQRDTDDLVRMDGCGRTGHQGGPTSHPKTSITGRGAGDRGGRPKQDGTSRTAPPAPEEHRGMARSVDGLGGHRHHGHRWILRVAKEKGVPDHPQCAYGHLPTATTNGTQTTRSHCQTMITTRRRKKIPTSEEILYIE